MTPKQIGLIKVTWDKVFPIADKAAELFYGKLFELDPELKPLFSGDMAEQGKKLMTSFLYMVIKLKYFLSFMKI